ncbi:MAG TPA: M1 family aminopeptidase [Candidatus Krumholzibacteria bacterium]|jgi:aminopeptidase N
MTIMSAAVRAPLLWGLWTVLCVTTAIPSGSAAENTEASQDDAAIVGCKRGFLSAAALAPRSAKRSANQDLFDVEHYNLFLRPDFTAQTIFGSVATTFTCLSDGLSRIELDLYDHYTVLSVTDGGTELSFTHANDIIEIQLAAPMSAGEMALLQVTYEGSPQPAGLLGMTFEQHDGNDILETLSEPFYARSWWPSKDVTTDKATSTMIVVVPAGMYVAGNGLLVARSVQPEGEYFVWENTFPIAPYLISIAATNYVQWTETWQAPSGKSMLVEYNVFPEHLAAAQVDFERTTDMLDFYSGLFGEYPYVDQKYGMAEFIYQGAMEHQTMTSYGDFLITGDKFYERLVGHELAHHWWGNAATVEDWNEIWLQEGFATYCEALWIENLDGPSAYTAFMWSRSRNNNGFNGPLIPPNKLFNETVYKKGAWVLHMLRHILGDADFFQALSNYGATEVVHGGNITTADFVNAVNTTVNDDLNWFFDQWLYTTGRPTFDLSWSGVGAGSDFRVDVQMDQVQGGQHFVMPVDVRVVTTAGFEDFVVWTNSANQSATFFVADQPTDVQIDPGQWLLRWINVVGTPTAAPSLGRTRLLANAPNPFNPVTILHFELEQRGPVQLRLFDTRGRLVRNFLPGVLDRGPHSLRFDGTDHRGIPLASGVYQLLLEATDQRHTRSITLVE